MSEYERVNVADGVFAENAVDIRDRFGAIPMEPHSYEVVASEEGRF